MAIERALDATIRPRRVPQSLCLLALFAVCAAAQVSEFEGRPIVDIQFSPAQTLDPADLARVFPLKKGEPLRAESGDGWADSITTWRLVSISAVFLRA